MNLKELKFNPIDKQSQIILFNQEGQIVDSDENLVQVLGEEVNVFKDTMFSGMEEVVREIQLGDDLVFDCINTDLFGRTSNYDFTIQRIDEESKTFAWIIYDFGPQYEKIFELQQERNIAEIKAKKAEREATQLKEEKEAIEKLYQELQQSQSSQYILVKSDSLLVNLDLQKVLYLEAYGDYIKVHTSDKVYITYNTMKKVETALPVDQFFRIHRSYIIRLDKVDNIEQLSLEINGKALPIGKSYKSSLIDKIGQL